MSSALGGAWLLLACGACATTSTRDAAPTAAPITQPKVVVEGRVVGASADAAALDFLARARRAETLAGARAVARLVAREPDHAAAALDSGAADTFSTQLRGAFEGGPGPRWRALAARVVELELATTQRALDAAAWEQALVGAATLNDPQLLTRLVEIAPRERAWPTASGLADACAAWARVAEWNLTRGEHGAATVATRRGASACTDTDSGARLAWIEARSAWALGERGRALERIAEAGKSGDAAVRNGATALRGVISAQAGDFADARAWLERALAGGDAWSGAGRAHHDLAGVLFQAGFENEAATHLARAREIAHATGDASGEVRALEVESAWRRSRGELDESRAAAKAAQELVLAQGLVLDN